ncbi:LamG-like jellyroll fold domain-containing protein [Lentzea cavernae]|uniref:LamG-like jellyroll fold domain-containing protein n=1 Tax=Lentzea cavernae TaxID=2020703 RepID=UPI00174C909E|nr:LamG-like jellyroll fold domain-containing protein [Lentzea cavernae]
MTLVIGVGGSGITALLPWFTDAGRELAEQLDRARGLAPEQDRGTADGLPSESTSGEGNLGMPVSEMAQHPRPKFGTPGQGPRNAAKVEQGPSNVTGYDSASSVPDSRARNETTYRNTDGTRTTEFSDTPLNYRKADGTWAPIDPSLVAENGSWRNKADGVSVHLAGRADASSLVTIKLDDAHEFAYGFAGARGSAGQQAGATVTYPGVADHADLRIESVPGGAKEILVLHDRAAARTWDFPLRLKGLTAKVVDGSVVLSDGSGRERLSIPPGFMTDSAPRREDVVPAQSFGVKYEITDGGRTLRVSLDSAWLDDPARVYPVLVDPTVFEGRPEARQLGQDAVPGELTIGSGKTALLKFGAVSTTLRNHKIFGAQLQLVNFDSATCKPQPMVVRSVAGNFTDSPPALGGAIGGGSFSHGFMSVGQTRSSCPAAPELIDLGVGGEQLVQGWANGGANNGIALQAQNQSNASQWKKIVGAGTANPPKLFVTHSPYNAEYVIDQPIPDPPLTSQQGGKVKIRVRNTGANAWDQGSYDLAYKVFNATTNELVAVKHAAGLPGTVNRGGEVTLDAAIEKLPYGKYIFDFTMRHGSTTFTDEQVAPGRITLDVFNLPPVVTDQYPPSGWSAETLRPQFWAKAEDHENDGISHKFEVCEQDQAGNAVGCFDSGFIAPSYWTVPENKLRWDRVYLWHVAARDSQGGESPYTEWSRLFASVPQPEVTSRMGNAPYTGNGLGFDPMVGNYTTAAIDAAAATTGPELNVARTYNSLDPRAKLTFGSGWSTRYDMRIVEDGDGSGNVVVTYPDGQQVRFGKNPDGSFTPPPGRAATLAKSASDWKLVDKDRTVYGFTPAGLLSSIKDSAQRLVELEYKDDNGKKLLDKVISRTSNRALFFAWNAEKTHVEYVRTEQVDGSALEWKYVYDADQLREVCDPTAKCTRYNYEKGSHYRSTVLDSRPDSYWRLGEAGGDDANSQISIKLGKDLGKFVGVGAPNQNQTGALNGSDDRAVRLGGGSHVTLPEKSVNKHRDLAIELWFKTTSAGPLVGYQDKAIGETPGRGVPLLYVGSDGKLRGQFWQGGINPITSSGAVNDDKWHHVVLSGSVASQTLFLDGKVVNTTPLEGPIDHALLQFAQVGAANTTGAWPSIASGRTSFSGLVDEVAFYARPLGLSQVATHHAAQTAGDQITEVTMPSSTNRVAARISYDHTHDRMREYVDSDGGRWQLGVPTVGGNEENIVRSVRVVDPGNRPQYYDFDGLKGRILRQVTPIGAGVRPEDMVGRDCKTNGDGITTCEGLVVALGVRLFEYDKSGFQQKIHDEVGNEVQLIHDERGNLTQKVSCREKRADGTWDCQTTHYKYQAPTGDPTDPRADKLLETRDARSSGPADNTFLTQSRYTDFGDLEQETNPDGGSTFHRYTDGSTQAYDSTPQNPALEPLRLLKSTTDPRGATTVNRYYRNGDLAETKSPAGMLTVFTYDVLGRKKTATEYSDSVPGGATTSYKYDKLGRVTEVTYPATKNAVTGVTHVETAKTEYDADGNTTAAELVDSQDPGNPRRSTFEFDDYGRMVKTIGPEGNEASFGYDVFGNRTWAIDANGVKTAFTYTARNKVAQVRLVGHHGKAITPGATGFDPLDPKTPLPDLVLESNQYDHSGKLIVQTDAMGRRTETSYYGDGLVKEIRAKADNKTGTPAVTIQQNTYDAAGNLTRQVGMGGKVVVHEVDATGRLKSSVQEPDTLRRRTDYTYDVSGNITKLTRGGAHSNTGPYSAAFSEVVDFEYDLYGRQVKESTRGSAGLAVTRKKYDQRDLVTSVIAPLGNVAGAVEAGHTTEYRYDERGRSVSMISPPVTTEQFGQSPSVNRPVSTTGYNAFGDVTHVRNPAGGVMTMAYDKAGRAVRTTSPSYQAPGSSTPATGVASVEYDAMGRATKTTDPSGASIWMYYDQRGRLVEKRDPNPDERTTPGGSWRYTYTDNGDLLSTQDPTGGTTQRTYDQFSRAVTQTVLETKPQPAAFETKFAYDAKGNLETVTSPRNEVTRFGYDLLGQKTSVTDAAGVVTQLGYDSFGNQVYSRDAQGRASYQRLDQAGNKVLDLSLAPNGQVLRQGKYTYDVAGNQLTATDPLGKVTKNTYDALGQLTALEEPVSATESITTSYGYDTSGRRTRVTDGRTNSTFYTYNALGKPESVVEPSTPAHPNPADRTWTTAYDTSGRPTIMTAPGGVTRTREYDGLGRLRKETGAGAAVSTTERLVGYDLVGRPTSVSAPGGSNTYEYNTRGLLTSATGPSGDASFGYDEVGRLSTRTDAAGTSSFSYVNGRLNSAQDGVSGALVAFGYNAAGMVESMNYGSGRVRTFGYDDFGRETSDTTKNSTGGTVASVGYEYDLADRLKKKTTTGTAGGGEQTYGYDDLGRMTSWTSGGATTEYGWDKSGNRIRNGAKTSTFDARNRLESDGDYTYKYSPRGTRESRTSSGFEEKFEFDAFDRLAKVGSATYTYDGLDRPVTRGSKQFKYSGPDTDPVSDSTSLFGRGAGGELLSLSSGSDKRLLLSDKHGDVVGGLDASTAELKDSTSYDPWGKVTASTGTKRAVGFQGDWTDPDSGHVNMGARWYDPSTGGFASRDSVDQGGPGSGGFNRYSYGVGSPVNGFDPNGHNWFSDAVSWVGDNISTIGHTALDVAGLIPGFGEIADGINAVWYLAEGNYTDAALSAAGMIPFGGWGATAAKWGNRGYDAVRGADNVPTPRSPDAPHPRRPDGPNAGKGPDGMPLKKTDVPNASKSLPDPRKLAAEAAARRAAAAAAAYQAAVRRTAAAKAAVARAVKTNPIPTLKAALKPRIANAKNIISAMPNAPARIVQTAVTNVQDLNKVYETIKTAMLGVGKEVVKEAAQAQVAETLATMGVPYAEDILDIAGGSKKKKRTGDKGKEAKQNAAAGGSCPVPWAASNSFVPGTLVVMGDGSRKKIEDLRAGEHVLATDPTTSTSGPREVTEVRTKTSERVMVELTDSSGGKIKATDEHPFWVESEKRWVKAIDLKPTYRFLTADNRSAEVTGTRTWSGIEKVHNFTVDGLHTYYVASSREAAPLLVHNEDQRSPDCDESLSGPSLSAGALNHVLHGEVLDNGTRFAGWHLHPDQTGGIPDDRFIGGTLRTTDDGSVRVVGGQVGARFSDGSIVAKEARAGHTFFPSDWTASDIEAAGRELFARGKPKNNGTKVTGKFNGVSMTGYLEKNADGNYTPSTFFPQGR